MLSTAPRLSWAEVDPTGRTFDPTLARVIAERHVSAAVGGDMQRHARVGGVKLEEVAEAIDGDLAAAYGAWVTGWDWAATEPGNGGPVREWCCARDSLLHGKDRDAHDSVERVVRAVQDWQSFLEQVAHVFCELREATARQAPARAVEHAAAALLPLVLARTDASDAWYATYNTVLCWYLESAGMPAHGLKSLVLEVIGGAFTSWVAPDERAARDVCRALGERIAGRDLSTLSDANATDEWLAIRPRAHKPFATTRRRREAASDEHRRFIDTRDRARDALRADRMHAALAACRDFARQGEPLTFELLQLWQELVLGTRAEFRSTEAFAKGGYERYALHADTETSFRACLQDANDTTRPAPIRAATVYLDVCFFHPFDDGNARAARLALDYVLAREGLALHATEPVFLVSRAANDASGAHGFAWSVEYLAGTASWLRHVDVP